MKISGIFFRLPVLVMFIMFAHSLSSEDALYTLRWKTGKDITAFRVTGTDISSSTLSVKDILTDEKSVINMPVETSMTLLLKRYDDDEITVNFYIDEIRFRDSGEDGESGDNAALKEMADSVNGKLGIIGRINLHGSVTSFWLAESQENLVAIFFELPERAVKPGDAWELHVNMISGDPAFRCRESARSTRVTFKSVERGPGNDVIAVLEYDILEKIKGTSSMGDIDCEMSYKGTGRFNITRGEWKNLDMVATIEMTGFMTASQKQLMKLVKTGSIPAGYTVVE